MAADPTVQTMWTRRCGCRVVQHVGEVKNTSPRADFTPAETQSQPKVQTQTLYLQWLRTALICRPETVPLFELDQK